MNSAHGAERINPMRLGKAERAVHRLVIAMHSSRHHRHHNVRSHTGNERLMRPHGNPAFHWEHITEKQWAGMWGPKKDGKARL